MINKTKEEYAIALVLLCLFIALLGSISLLSTDTFGANNATTITRVLITNTAPTLSNLIVEPSSIDLIPGSITTINCTGNFYDSNGWDDIGRINATFYDITYGPGTTQDFNFRYINNSCGNATTACTQLSATNSSCTCKFNIRYFANNGSWICNMTIADEFGLSSTDNSSFAAINPTIGISAPSEIDYGNLSITETSAQKSANLSNYGNVQINISLRGYGGTDPDNQNNLSMICDGGSISNTYERYSVISGTAFDSMYNISNETVQIPNFNLPVRTNDTNYGSDRNTTYWRIYIPSTVSGYCNGTLEFYAVQI